jgi:hypothetical protein
MVIIFGMALEAGFGSVHWLSTGMEEVMPSTLSGRKYMGQRGAVAVAVAVARKVSALNVT